MRDDSHPRLIRAKNGCFFFCRVRLFTRCPTSLGAILFGARGLWLLTLLPRSPSEAKMFPLMEAPTRFYAKDVLRPLPTIVLSPITHEKCFSFFPTKTNRRANKLGCAANSRCGTVVPVQGETENAETHWPSSYVSFVAPFF